MAQYNGTSKRIKNALKAVLAGIQYDAGDGNEPAMYVQGSSHGKADHYPCLRVLPADIDEDKKFTYDNDRNLRLLLMVELPMEERDTVQESEEATYDKMYDLTDLIFDTLAKADVNSELQEQDVTLDTYLLNASRGDWYPVESNDGILLVCDINVEVKYAVQLLSE